ncbi:uncharacterized protein SPPG_09153 [Spizellomyces punctatus DAOM BR117]|uniref:Uncharacterized protein n=1 Tax=Spizellomyces punctatus (strain DAOM BR117) TaxID=645134 RepID=A0A0L0HIU6_SPIPD|nr:uncharacterized protein SPPG_09153 [Spizellomyces punctatus DAOM BR117]KND00749.1 hypothetical protein SPPG_09153 [Spizellomyces punctatus DAOM BR117]|eukprot:XP_016608788.1 hypothetical protein SPPG_09153 [Spizellomyces punctatus DAOM BR117]
MSQKSMRAFEEPAPARAHGVPQDHDPPRLSTQGIERDPKVAALAELGRGPPAAEAAKHHAHEHDQVRDHKLQPNSSHDNKEARFHQNRHRVR